MARARSATAYLAEFERGITGLGLTLDPMWGCPSEANPQRLALVDAIVTFPGFGDRTRLRVSENVDMRRGQDPRVAYVYQFMHGGRTVFAYHRDRGGKPHADDHRHVYGPDGKTISRTVITATARHVAVEAQEYLRTGVVSI